MIPVVLLLLFAARADEPAPAPASAPADKQPVSGDIIVYGTHEVERKRQALDQQLRGLGYKPKVKDGVTIYRPDSPWHPSLYVYKDGFIVMRRTPVRFEPPIAGSSNLRYLACLPPFTPLCVRPGGQLIAHRKLEAEKGRVAQAMDPAMRAWQGALVNQGMEHRLDVEIPALLTATWEQGQPLQAGAPLLANPDDRRKAILDFWATRADTPEGDEVRHEVDDFLRYEVQTSPWPVTQAEIEAAEKSCACGRTLLGPETPPTTPDAGAPPSTP